ncbi:MAG: Tex-like N-terminal domain-containing protein [Candidatus Hydrogenedentota bacterium]
MIDTKFVERVAQEGGVTNEQAARSVALFDEGATIPFVARYRKDVTGNLDEVQLERILERATYYKELEERKKTVLDAIAKQDQLTDERRERIEACVDKTTLEDLYLPFKKRRRTKATTAREKGLEPLADLIWAQDPEGTPPEEAAQAYIDAEKGINTAEEALEGAQHILAERVSLNTDLRARLREQMAKEGQIAAHATKNAEGRKTKFETYYDFREPVSKIPSHRFLAIVRGSKEGTLRMELEMDDDQVIESIAADLIRTPGSPYEALLRQVASDAYRRLLRPSLENEVTNTVRERAEEEAIRVFRENAENLLLSPPAGPINIIGVDPGIRTGCKLAVVDSTGAYRESATIYPPTGESEDTTARDTLLGLIERHAIQAIAIGNGTGAREASAFIRPLLAEQKRDDIFCVLVNEAGASIYSASKVAREEFPDLDLTIRGAISIARRLQDPLAELVKIDPRHIGVGQYQHDVNQKQLREGLRRTVVSCVNRVGVNLNTASPHLLRYVSGIQAGVARSIVAKREALGGFTSRRQLLEADGVGPKTFEQCAGFLRIQGGENPLDATGIHPEAYPVAEQMAQACGVNVADLIGNKEALKDLDVTPFQTDTIGILTLRDIVAEFLKPGRDPRKEFRAPQFKEGVTSVEHLEEGMDLEGVVTNVTDFGAFIDVGVHQDGLVHLSQLANHYVRDPHSVVKVGDIVNVKVLKVDKEMPRISLSIKALQPKPEGRKRSQRGQQKRAGEQPGAEKPAAAGAEKTGAAKEEGGARRARQEKSGREGEKRTDGAGRRRQKEKRRKEPESRPRQDKAQGEEEPANINTQLADQLQSLRDKLGSS